MGKRKLKVSFVITGIFLICFVISFLISDIMKKTAVSTNAAEVTATGDVQTGDTVQMIEDEDKVAAQAPGTSDAFLIAESDDTAPAETASEEITEDNGTEEDAAALEDEAAITKDMTGTKETAAEEISPAPESALSADDSDVIDTTEDSYATTNTDAEGLIGILSTPEWYDAIDVAPTCDYVIANVNEILNVRAEPDKNADLVGKLMKDSYAKILERGDEWTKIESGDVVGYVYNAYLYMDEAALERLSELDAYKVVVNVNVLNVREQPNTECSILGKSTVGDEFTYLQEQSVDGWNAVQYDENTVAYVSDEFTDVVITLDTAITIKEYEAALKAAALAKALEESKKSKPAVVNRDPITLSDEDIYLMSVVIAMESLSESHEGKVAVANVIINRMLNGSWGSTVSDVVYAPGQFTGANSGRVEQFWNKVSKDCMDAAVEALAGYNNVGDYLFFISIGKADYSKYSKYYVLGGHCFYARN